MLQPPPTGSHRAWWTLPEDEPYPWRQLGYHLLRADLRDELHGLLLDFDWIAAKLKVTDINALLSDYDPLSGDGLADLVQGALRLAAHVLAKDRTQWDLATGAVVATFTADRYLPACAIAPDGVTIVAGDGLGRVHFLRLKNA
jgi:hypothetical protein